MTTPVAQPRPILKAAGIIGVSTAVVGTAATTLTEAGLVGSGVAHVIAAIVAVVLPLGAALGVWQFSEGQVTPVSSPFSATGKALSEPNSVIDVAKAVEPAVTEWLASKYGVAGADVATQAAALRTSISDLTDDSKSIYSQMKAGN